MDYSRIRALFFSSDRPKSPEPPIRAELFGLERLEQHAQSLATAQHAVTFTARGRPIAPQLEHNAQSLRDAYRVISTAAHERRPIPPAAEWLLDNYHVVDEQVREIKDDLPPGFYRRLPKLRDGHLQGYPRVFGMAWALVAHTDSALDVQKLTAFVESYQRVQPLTIGELWAIAITLRIVLVENLRRLTDAIVLRLSAQDRAEVLAERLLQSDDSPDANDALLDELKHEPLSPAFAVYFLQRIRDRGPNTLKASALLNQRLTAQNIAIDQLTRDEVQDQTASNVTVRNVIMSMRLISTINWQEFFESVSLVDSVLRSGSDFAAMDFQTRDLYRNAIEDLARGSSHSEIEIAERAVEVAKQKPLDDASDIQNAAREEVRRRDPGYYLIGHGRPLLEKQLTCRIGLKTRIFRTNNAVGIVSYVAAILIVTVTIAIAAVSDTTYHDAGLLTPLLLFLCGFIPASDIAVAVLNLGITKTVGPRILPAMSLRQGVPDELRTIVVIPTLLTTPEKVEEQVEQLEVHFLANSDRNIFLGLLSDWTDSRSEDAANDKQLLDTAAAAIANLNQRYARAGEPARFYLFHRHRIWNDGEGKWMGWERKRGKLHELNRLLRGAADTTFVSLDSAPVSYPEGIQYVLTVDADTRLPIDTARRLIGKMAHPLNRAAFDKNAARVVDGYGILQPRVSPSLPVGSGSSLFQRTFSGPNGLDPYARVVSDIYQDLYDEGSYWGKGIYEVDAFEAALHGRIPESTVLSHDLLEGILARAGISSDVEVVEEFPSRYEVSVARQHRWARGDWQLLPWIFGPGPIIEEHGQKPAIPLIGRWKLLDNLRRSLSAPSALLAFLLGWLLPLRAPLLWTIFVTLTVALPPLLPGLLGLIPRQAGFFKRGYLIGAGRDLALALLQAGFLITFLAHQAWLMTDAFARTIYRLFVRRRGLLEWVTAAQIAETTQLDRRSLFLQLINSIGFAIILGCGLYFLGRDNTIAAPLVTVWAFSPFVARWISRPPQETESADLDAKTTESLRLVARRTWRFFEQFIGEEDNMLPPDNFQENPKPVVAHRTSPTNIGLYLLSVITARDFGWIGTLDALERIEATFASLDRLEKFRGHFFNWYDTRDLRPLEPKYISTVDSGNLAGHLIALSNACLEICVQPVRSHAALQGITDTLALLQQSYQAEAKKTDGSCGGLGERISAFARIIEESVSQSADILSLLERLETQANLLVDSASDLEQKTLAQSLLACVQSHRRDRVLLSAVPPDATQSSHRSLQSLCEATTNAINAITPHIADQNFNRENLQKTFGELKLLERRLHDIGAKAKSMAEDMEFGFLFDEGRKLFSIGYRYSDSALDGSFYDLLASEARLASFFAIAKHDLPAEHWFHLGRALTNVEGGAALLSWSGSMFEYLMPSLVMRGPAGSLLEQTNKLIVTHQERYGEKLGVPWGISESEYNARDIDHNYQYSGFGVPDLGFKRGLSQETVIAPYATGLAAMIDPKAAARNFSRFAKIGAQGSFGMYEALDYTRARLPEGAKVAIIKAYMAHHQAMTIISIANALLDGVMQSRFHSEPMIKAAELLLQERMPRDVVVTQPLISETPEATLTNLIPETQRRFTSAHSAIPRTQLLSNSSFALMVTAAGSGYCRWKDLEITRWREDVTRDNWGSYIFLRDTQSRQVWSATYQPTTVEPDSYEVTFSEDRVQIDRADGSIASTLEIIVSPEDEAEVRRISITNSGKTSREIEITSYAELALAHAADDIAHPAFSKLFVETEFVSHLGALLAHRRRRSDSDPEIWAMHLSTVEGDSGLELQYETDRARFLGRGQSVRTPTSVMEGWPLSDTAGPVLDPVFSLRRRLRIAPGATAHVVFWTAVGDSRDQILALADKLNDPMAFERVATLAWTQSQMELQSLSLTSEEAHLFQRLANHVIYANPALRASADIIRRGLGRKSQLWSQGISGDLPIVLIELDDQGDIEFVRTILRARSYWRSKRLAVDVVILNNRAASYVQELQTSVETLVRNDRAMPKMADGDVKGSVFVLRSDLVPSDVQDLLRAIARVALRADRGSLHDQLDRTKQTAPQPLTAPPRVSVTKAEPPLPRPDLDFFNGLGGFTKDGREYVTILEGNDRTPVPWSNIIANPDFGFAASAEGGGFTWSTNSQQNQITAWSNDPVCDMPGEIIYVRDDETGEIWGPTQRPIREKTSAYRITQGQGYTKYEYAAHGIALELVQFVPFNDPVKVSRLRITNQSGRDRKLSIYAYVEWALGTARPSNAPFVVTEIDPKTGAIFAQNCWNEQFSDRVAFMDMAGHQSGWTGDRAEFLGRDGNVARPLALARSAPLSGRTGAGLDPCGAMQTSLRLSPIGRSDVFFFMGEAASKSDAQNLVLRYRDADLEKTFLDTKEAWDRTLSVVQVKTPERALDNLVNRWLLYQTLSCRIWGRAGFYQASGAYGFRDQLQDVMALCVARPEIARAHILRAAGRQFAEGDVQHWWLPESGQGIRTRVSDDRPWLAYVTAHYVSTTGDFGVLDEQIPFLTGPTLEEGQSDSFFQPGISQNTVSLFEHCALALDKSLATGAHGLPLMGTGDWNDGMNNVGADGRGESVWLAWFLISALTQFADLADQHGQQTRAQAWRQSADALKAAAEQHAWDGDWYRRAYFDDGTPLGSVTNSECRLDSIAQSWAVMSCAAEDTRARRAMAAVDKYLIRRDQKLSLLFSPPFDDPPADPGYIKGYPPGIRENGGQYTHAAMWNVIAWTMLGEGNKAGELLAMLNPINHARNRADVERYKVEPYVICADVYSMPPHTGRGGWTWYTGSSGWFYRAALEHFLGFRVQGKSLLMDPCIPKAWPGFEIAFKYRSSKYDIAVENPLGVCRGILAARLDEQPISATGSKFLFPLTDDGAAHRIQIVLG